MFKVIAFGVLSSYPTLTLLYMKSNPYQVIKIYVVISCMTVPFVMGTDNTYIISKELCSSLSVSTFRFVDVSACRRFGLSMVWFVDVSAC